MKAHTSYRGNQEESTLALRHTAPFPAYPVSQERTGRGEHFPWTAPPTGRYVRYNADDYPRAGRLLDCSFLFGCETYPPRSRDGRVLDAYAGAFCHGYTAPEEIVASSTQPRRVTREQGGDEWHAGFARDRYTD